MADRVAMTRDLAARCVGVAHCYGSVAALEDVNLEIPARCFVGVIGPDGVGKSTLLGLIAGIRAVQVGDVFTLGQDVRSAPRERELHHRVGYLPQELGGNLYPDLSAAENLEVFGRVFGMPRADRIAYEAKLLAATGLTEFRDRPAHLLSGGMRQKLGLCCALLHDPELLILDEPTTGVDPLSRRQFWSLIDRLRRRRPGSSLIVSTAHMEEAECFDWLVVMAAGRVLAAGSARDLRERTGAADVEGVYAALVGVPRYGRRHGMLPNRARVDPPAIEARDLTRRFGSFTAVDDVSFRIARGEIFAFVGANGCGKTTTMKLLTGLLAPTSGEARLFGRVLDASDMGTRAKIGFMSQTFSLYGELSVRENLQLHARLYGVSPRRVAARVADVAQGFDLADVLGARADRLPLGVRQRLSLAVAVVHEPEVLILDEPTSGVDPTARERFWDELLHLARENGVTIFLSTHFMNEAARCDRVALMHAGRLLAVGTPEAIVSERGARNLEEAFAALLGSSEDAGEAEPATAPLEVDPRNVARCFDLRRAYAHATRIGREMLRDRVRLAFAAVGPAVFLCVFGYGLSFDIERATVVVFDQDGSAASRRYADEFGANRWFARQAAVHDAAELEERFRGGDLRVAVEIPSGFGRELRRGRFPEVAVLLDGAMPFTAETVQSYVAAASELWIASWWREQEWHVPPSRPASVETRFLFNPDFASAFAIVPGVVMIVLILVPAVMTAVAAVRERETGAIVNFYASPMTRLEFILGMQAPYVAVGALIAIEIVALAVLQFGIHPAGSIAALALGVLLYLTATTALGLALGGFMRTQISAIFATAIVASLPAIRFSGLLVPAASLSGSGRLLSSVFPCASFHEIGLGVFAKGLGVADLVGAYASLAGYTAGYLAIACIRLRTKAP